MTAASFSRIRSITRVVSLALLLFSGWPITAATAAPAPATGTEILWDRYGIPHIFAADHPSLFHAYGYAQMEGHAELLVRLYAQARGRAAEFYGDAYLAATGGCGRRASRRRRSSGRRSRRLSSAL